MAEPTDFVLRGEHITLDALLKATGLAPSGGGAKQMIAAGQVEVDGQVEMRRGAKLRAGQHVQCGATSFRLMAAAQSGARPEPDQKPEQDPDPDPKDQP